MKSQTKNQLLAVLALSIAGGVVAYASLGDIGENLVYFWSPEELLGKGEAAYGATVRLGGVVQPGTHQWDPESLNLEFHVSMTPDAEDPQNVAVKASGAPPGMFREGIGVVVEGVYDGRVFRADRVLVKHSNEYRAPDDPNATELMNSTLIEP